MLGHLHIFNDRCLILRRKYRVTSSRHSMPRNPSQAHGRPSMGRAGIRCPQEHLQWWFPTTIADTHYYTKIIEFTINSELYYFSNGTDGFRLLCHQFYISSLLLLANCISNYKTYSLTVKPMTPAIPRLLANGDQGQNTRNTVFPLNNGR